MRDHYSFTLGVRGKYAKRPYGVYNTYLSADGLVHHEPTDRDAEIRQLMRKTLHEQSLFGFFPRLNFDQLCALAELANQCVEIP